MRRTKEDAEQTRKQVLEAAMRVFIRQGFSATKLSEIAMEAGTTRGAIYWHFENKMDLYGTLVKDGLKGFHQHIVNVLQKDGSFIEKIREIFREFCDLTDEDAMYYQLVKGFFLSVKVVEELKPLLVEIYNTGFEIVEVISSEISKAKENGEIRNDVDTEQLAISVLNFIAMIGEKVGDHRHSECVTGRELKYDVDFFIELIFNGFNSIKV